MKIYVGSSWTVAAANREWPLEQRNQEATRQEVAKKKHMLSWRPGKCKIEHTCSRKRISFMLLVSPLGQGRSCLPGRSWEPLRLGQHSTACLDPQERGPPAPASRRIQLGADLLAEIWPDLEWCAAEQRCSGAPERGEEAGVRRAEWMKKAVRGMNR
jgi:hypothetical protein